MSHDIGPGEGCLVCERVRDGAPILYGTRDEPINELDSGWQFLCGSEDHGQAGSEQASIIARAEVLELEPRLRGFLELPPGTEVERQSEAHVFERRDVPYSDYAEFECPHCLEFHPTLPLTWEIDRPARHDAANGWEISERSARWQKADTVEHFYRGTVQLPVFDAPECFEFSVWIAADPDGYATVRHLLADGAGDGISGPFAGRLACNLPGYPDTLDLPVQVRFAPGAADPLVAIDAPDHPLAIEQYAGVSMARVHELDAIDG